MKNINKLSTILVLLLCFWSCDLDINEDPNNPITADVHELLPSGQLTVIEPLSNLINAICSSVVQTRVSTRHDNYNYDISTITNIWNNQFYSGGLNDLEQVIIAGTESESWHYVGIAKLMKAYIFSVMVDLWNDIPYSDAFQPDIETINYDAGSDIYPRLIALIEEALGDLNKSSNLSPGSDDVIYGGDLAKWNKMAKTLLLKMYNQTRLVDSSVGSKIQTLIDEKSTIQSISDDFQLVFGSSAAPENRIPLFVSDYVIRLDNRISNYFGDLMYGKNDPRIPFYFFNQTPGEFLGRDAGNPSGLAQFEDQPFRTYHGAYPAGGQFDAGQGGTTNGDMGLKGAGTFRMMTNAMRIFIEAEAVLTLGVKGSGTAEALFEEGIRESMKKVNELGVGTITDTQIDDYVAARMSEFDAADAGGKLKLVIMEKYIHQFGNGFEQYNDWRRTGIPDDLTLVVETGVILYRFPYPTTENPPKRPPNNEFVFWDN